MMEYNEFRQQYEDQHPASVPRMEVEMNEYPPWVRPAVLLTFVCAALVSGVHTVPTVWKSIEVGTIITEVIRNVISVASLVAVEMAILLSAYLMAKGVRLAYFVTFIASSVAVMANLYSVVTAFNTSDDKGALAVAVVLGIGAPLIALFTGKMFVDIHRADRIQDARAHKLFREASVAWDKEVGAAFKKYQKEHAGEISRNFMKSDEAPPLHEVSRNPVKPRVKLHEVAKEIHENGDAGLSASEMMEKYSISLGSTTRVREILNSRNGHSKVDAL